MYSFALHPKKIQPSGALNMSEMKKVTLRVETIPVDQFVCQVFVIDVYCIQYNILSIVGGVGGVQYGN